MITLTTTPLNQQALQQSERELSEAVYEIEIDVNSKNDLERTSAWLGACRNVLRACRNFISVWEAAAGDVESDGGQVESLPPEVGQPDGILPSASPSPSSPRDPSQQPRNGSATARRTGADSEQSAAGLLATHLQSSQRALRAISSRSDLHPVLLVHPLQAEALSPWLQPAAAGPASSSTPVFVPSAGKVSGSVVDLGDQRLEPVIEKEGSSDKPLIQSHRTLPDGYSMPSRLHLFGDVSLDLERYLLDKSEMARDAEISDPHLQPVSLRLSSAAISAILQHHPDEGVRWQASLSLSTSHTSYLTSFPSPHHLFSIPPLLPSRPCRLRSTTRGSSGGRR